MTINKISREDLIEVKQQLDAMVNGGGGSSQHAAGMQTLTLPIHVAKFLISPQDEFSHTRKLLPGVWQYALWPRQCKTFLLKIVQLLSEENIELTNALLNFTKSMQEMTSIIGSIRIRTNTNARLMTAEMIVAEGTTFSSACFLLIAAIMQCNFSEENPPLQADIAEATQLLELFNTYFNQVKYEVIATKRQEPFDGIEARANGYQQFADTTKAITVELQKNLPTMQHNSLSVNNAIQTINNNLETLLKEMEQFGEKIEGNHTYKTIKGVFGFIAFEDDAVVANAKAPMKNGSKAAAMKLNTARQPVSHPQQGERYYPRPDSDIHAFEFTLIAEHLDAYPNDAFYCTTDIAEFLHLETRFPDSLPKPEDRIEGVNQFYFNADQCKILIDELSPFFTISPVEDDESAPLLQSDDNDDADPDYDEARPLTSRLVAFNRKISIMGMMESPGPSISPNVIDACKKLRNVIYKEHFIDNKTYDGDEPTRALLEHFDKNIEKLATNGTEKDINKFKQEIDAKFVKRFTLPAVIRAAVYGIVGALLGATSFALVGAAVGTGIAPGVGSAAGGVIGGIGGGLVGFVSGALTGFFHHPHKTTVAPEIMEASDNVIKALSQRPAKG